MPVDSNDSDDATFLNGEEAEATLGVHVIGHLPLIEETGLRLIRDISHFSPLMESYRALRVNIGFATEPHPLRTLAITSAVPAEGKSSVVANLAMAIAVRVENNRVIVVDADLRRPTQHKLFKMEVAPGLVDVLRGTHSVDQVLRPTTVPNVFVIPAGTPPPNPTELLESQAMRRLLDELTKRCDVVLLDTPPALAVADGPVVASLSDGVIVVIGCGETKRTNTKTTMKLLSRAKATVIGTVLNRISGPASGYYYGKYYVPSDPAPKDEETKPPEVRKRVTRKKTV